MSRSTFGAVALDGMFHPFSFSPRCLLHPRSISRHVSASLHRAAFRVAAIWRGMLGIFTLRSLVAILSRGAAHLVQAAVGRSFPAPIGWGNTRKTYQPRCTLSFRCFGGRVPNPNRLLNFTRTLFSQRRVSALKQVAPCTFR